MPCLASTPSECLYHVCIFVAALQSTYPHLPCPSYNPRMILCQSPPRLDNRPIRVADAQEQPQINTLRPAYTACTSIRRSTIVVVLAYPAHTSSAFSIKRSSSREIVRYAAPTRLISLSAICRTVVHPSSSASTRRCTMSTSLLPPASLSWQWRWLVPRGRHGGGSGSTGICSPSIPRWKVGGSDGFLFASPSVGKRPTYRLLEEEVMMCSGFGFFF